MNQNLRILLTLCFLLMMIPVMGQDEKPKQLVAEEIWKELPDLDRALSDSVPPDTSTVILSDLQIPRSFLRTKTNELNYAENLDGFFQLVSNRKNRSVRVVHIGDSHVRGHVLPVAVRRKLEAAWGSEAMKNTLINYNTSALAQETGQKGFIFHAIGKNGATMSYFLDEAVIQQIARLNPDLVIISIGTNESHGRFTVAALQQNFDTFTTRMRQLCPGVSFLLTTPPGSYRRRMPNRVGGEVARAQSNYGSRHGIAVWNLYEIAGGDARVCANWRGAGMMARDGVHYTHEAYNLQGNLLGEAILKAYNKWTTTNRKQTAEQ